MYPCQIFKADEDSDMYKSSRSSIAETAIKALKKSRTLEIKLPLNEKEEDEKPPPEAETGHTRFRETSMQDLSVRVSPKKTADVHEQQQKLEPQLSRKWSVLSGGLQSPRTEVPKAAILQRINSKKVTRSYQLGHQLSRKWSTGAGPRIGCVNDYPPEVRHQALEIVNLSPRQLPAHSAAFCPIRGLASPNAQPCIS